MFLKRLMSSLIIVLLIFSMVAARLPAAQEEQEEEKSTRTEQQEESRKQAESKALSLLDEIFKEGQRLTLVENRIYVQIITADLLWKRDEARARALFKGAASELNQLLSIPSNLDSNDAQQSYSASRMQTQLRTQLLQALARHDARLARDFLRTTRRSATSTTTSNNAQPEESQMELNLASQLAMHDPKQAVEVAEESLARGLSYQLPQIVTRLQQKDREAATKLASSIVAKLRNENLATNNEASSAALSLLRILAEPGADNSQTGSKSAPPIVDEQVLRDLSEMLATASLKAKSSQDEALSLTSVMTIIEKYAPSRAALLRSKAAQSNQSKRPGAETEIDWEEYKALVKKGDIEAMLEAAQKAPYYMRSQLYRQAALKALSQDDPARAQQIINQNITEPYQRKHMLADLERQMLTRAAEKGKIDEAKQMIAQARTNEERVLILTQLATGIGVKGDKKVALQLLEEARSLSSERARNIKQLTAQLQVARAYAVLDPARSLAILESLMGQINELLNAALLLGGFLGEDEIVKDDELMLLTVASITERFSHQYVPDLVALAEADFERTKGVADSFQRDEIRLMARLLIAQSILADRTATGNQTVVTPMLGPEGPFGDDVP